ncbi:hypothetical protein [Terrabacter sp. NPDC080008]|uniref:hypothetical protein n=1 Tax=Terrabacter sp. NPDC080008 TaxID=3155176 RepID=UPI00344C267B
MRDASGRDPRSFDPVVVGHHETDAWAAYYRHEWPAFLRGAYGMVSAGFGLLPVDAVRGAWWVLRANQLWAPYPDNDPQGAREQMRRFYALVARHGGLAIDPARASALEVEWWRVHRAHQHHEDVTRDQLVAALVDLYAYVYTADPASLETAAQHRVEAMDLSDRWVAAGCDRADPLLAAERRALVASYSALLDAVVRVQDRPS